jgi:sporulation protein YabP
MIKKLRHEMTTGYLHSEINQSSVKKLAAKAASEKSDMIRKNDTMMQTGDGLINDHSISLQNRRQLTLTGVKEVSAFDELEIILETEAGGLLIKGKGLAVKTLTLDIGLLEIEGMVDGIIYSKNAAPKSKEPLVKRLFS